MTDEQILKRLGEIEFPYRNERHFTFHDKLGPCIWNYDPDIDHSYTPWNPLTNWSDLGPLIEKYRLQIVPPSKFEEDCFSIRELWTVCAYDSSDGAKSASLPHASCLAIIEANGGMGDE